MAVWDLEEIPQAPLLIKRRATMLLQLLIWHMIRELQYLIMLIYIMGEEPKRFLDYG